MQRAQFLLDLAFMKETAEQRAESEKLFFFWADSRPQAGED